MRVTENLLRQNNKDRQKKIKDRNSEWNQMEAQKEWKDVKNVYLNRSESVFASKMNEGINNQASVFDRQAVFRTSNK